MKFTGLTFVVAALAGLAAAAPAPTVNGKLECGSSNGDNLVCPFGQICVLAPGSDTKSPMGICKSMMGGEDEPECQGRWIISAEDQL
ncbi:hypothetical protein V8C37DRAFT_404405 [Trichoderma ceciliae]